jgi:hypothetical protein
MRIVLNIAHLHETVQTLLNSFYNAIHNNILHVLFTGAIH